MAFGSQSFIKSLMDKNLRQSPLLQQVEGLAGPPIAEPATARQIRDLDMDALRRGNELVMDRTRAALPQNQPPVSVFPDSAPVTARAPQKFSNLSSMLGREELEDDIREDEDWQITPADQVNLSSFIEDVGTGKYTMPERHDPDAPFNASWDQRHQDAYYGGGIPGPGFVAVGDQTEPNYGWRSEVGKYGMDASSYGRSLQSDYDAYDTARGNMGIGGLGPDFSNNQGLGAYTDAMGYGATSGTIGRGTHAGLTSVGATYGPEGWAIGQPTQYSSQAEAVAASIAAKGRATQAALEYEQDREIGSGGDPSDDDGTVICTELHRQGLINGDLFRADKKVGETLMRTDPDLMAGYHAWGRPVAKILKKYPVLALIVKPLVLPVIKELAVKEGGSLFGSVVGKAMLFIGAPICRAIGRMRKVDICAQY